MVVPEMEEVDFEENSQRSSKSENLSKKMTLSRHSAEQLPRKSALFLS